MSATNQEVTVADIIKGIKKTVSYLFSKWLLILIAGIIGGIAGLIYAVTAKPDYTASVSFILSNGSNGSSSFSGLANQFGINLGTSTDDAFAGDNIKSLMSSANMVQKALLLKPEGNSLNLANIISNDLKLDKYWQSQERTKSAYPFPDATENLKPVQDSLLRELYFYVQKHYLSVYKPDDDQSIYKVSITSGDETVSYWLTKYLVDVTSDFYINTKTSVAKQNLQMLQHEADSLRVLLGGAITTAASQTDQTFNLNPAYQVQRSASQQSQAKATVLGSAYGEVVKNLEIAKITLLQLTPLYQVIDEPKLPLVADKPGKFTSLIIGGLLAGIVAVIYLLIKKVLIIYS